MKTKEKVAKRIYKKRKNMEDETKIELTPEEKIEPLTPPFEVTNPSTSAEPVKVTISSFSGEFGREDMNKLKDKVNEIIDFLNSK